MIASAVEEQTATTAEMNRSVADTAVTAEQIAVNVATFAQAAQHTTGGVGQASRPPPSWPACPPTCSLWLPDSATP